MAEHRWSGWPGAVCLKCGAEDPIEACMASQDGLWTDCDCAAGCIECKGTGMLEFEPCEEHQPKECPHEDRCISRGQ